MLSLEEVAVFVNSDVSNYAVLGFSALMATLFCRKLPAMVVFTFFGYIIFILIKFTLIIPNVEMRETKDVLSDEALNIRNKFNESVDGVKGVDIDKMKDDAKDRYNQGIDRVLKIEDDVKGKVDKMNPDNKRKQMREMMDRLR